MSDTIQIKKDLILDILDTKSPALSATSDMPVIETKPDASNEGKPPEAKAETPPATEDVKTEGESATPPAEAAASDKEPEKKPAKGVQKALDRLTKQREEAEARAKAAEERIAKLEAEIQARQAPETKPEEPKEPERPKKTDFSDPDAYDMALEKYFEDKATFTARREVETARQADLERQHKQAQDDAAKAVRDAFVSRTEAVKAKYEDFDAVTNTDEVQVSMAMAHAIVNHEQGPEIQYFLGKNPEEAKRISALPIASQIMELGAIAAGLRTPAATAPQPKPVTKAPAPIKPVTTGTVSAEKSIDEMSMEEYAAMRKPQLQAERRPGRR